MPENLPRLHFGLFHREGCGLSRLSVQRMQRRVGSALNTCLVDCFRCLNSNHHFLIPPKSCFFPLFATPSRFCPHTRPAHEATAALERLPLRLSVRCAFRELFEVRTRTIRCLQRTFLHLCPPGPPTSFGGITRCCTICRPWRLFHMQVIDQ